MQVSVIMTAYNSERFLRGAVDSVLAQTYQEFELLIVDDGSTDGTAEILAEFAAKDSRISVIRQPNRGIAAASNRAILAAKHELVAKIDSDDRMLPNRLERQVQFYRDNPQATVVSSYYYVIDSRGKRIGSSGIGNADGNTKANGGNPLNVVWIHNTTVLMRKKDILELGGYSERFTHGEEDRDLWGRVVTSGRIIKCQPEFLTEYRLHAGSITIKNAECHLAFQRFTELNISRRLRGEANLTREEFDQIMRARPLLERLNDRRTSLSFAFFNRASRLYGERKLLQFLCMFGISVSLRPVPMLSRAAKRIKTS